MIHRLLRVHTRLPLVTNNLNILNTNAGLGAHPTVLPVEKVVEQRALKFGRQLQRPDVDVLRSPTHPHASTTLKRLNQKIEPVAVHVQPRLRLSPIFQVVRVQSHQSLINKTSRAS
jgi:hypothetical protein